MTPAHLGLLLLFPVLIAVSGFCTAAEVATFSLAPTDRVRLRRASPRAARLISELLESPRRLLLSILLLANASNVTFFVGTAVAVQWIDGRGLQALLSGVSLLALILLSDLLPLMLARRLRVGFCRVFAPVLVIVVRVCGPVSRMLEDVAVVPASRLLRPGGAGPDPFVSAEELGALLDLSAEEGLIEEDEQRLLADVIGLATLRVRDVMVPRVAMAWVAEAASAAKVREVARITGGGPVAVFRGSPDGPALGFLDMRRFLPASEGDSPAPKPAEFLTKAMFVPERARLDRVLDQFRTTGQNPALCVDEYGGIVGVLTIRDVLAQVLPGAPEPRGDAAGRGSAAVERQGPNRWLVSGRLRIGELTRSAAGAAWGGRAMRGGVSTVAGLVLLELGRVPTVGDEVRIGNIALRVESMSGRAIQSVSVSVEDAGVDGGQP